MPLDQGFTPVEEARQVAARILETEGCPFDVQLSLTLTGEEEIRQANREFRGIDRVTDVLSFPMTDFDPPADFASVEGDPACFDLETGELLLGDIMICVQRVLSQAEEYGHGIRREFCFLVAHSVLHLLGYDHEDNGLQRLRMREKEEKVMTLLGLPSSSSYVIKDEEE